MIYLSVNFFRMTIVEASFSAGSVLGSLASSYLLRAVGNVYLLLIAASLCVIAYVFTNCCLDESLPGAKKVLFSMLAWQTKIKVYYIRIQLDVSISTQNNVPILMKLRLFHKLEYIYYNIHNILIKKGSYIHTNLAYMLGILNR